MNRALKFLLPILVLLLGGLVFWSLVNTRPPVDTRSEERSPPLIRTATVEKQDLKFKVFSQGTVRPRTDSLIVPQVSGQVVKVSESWAEGAFFTAGEVLLEIDSTDYELALAQADLQVAQARIRVAQEEQEAEVARSEWEELGKKTARPSPLVLRELQLAEARAAVNAAEAAKKQAIADLDRTKFRAPPFDGRILETSVDLGQYVTRGSPMGRAYSVDQAEVRLPIPDDEFAFMNLPLEFPGSKKGYLGLSPNGEPGWVAGAVPEVTLKTTFAGRVHSWQGQIVRSEGEIDPKTRMVHVVARVEDPYGLREDKQRPPLAVGLFVEAEIHGHTVEGVALLPRQALRGKDQVLVVDNESRLRFREVTVLRTQVDKVAISDGLEEGERVCVSPLEIVVDGMEVRTEIRKPE